MHWLYCPSIVKFAFLITSDDVIHSWWVPDIRGEERIPLPGFINEAWTKIDEPGVYRGQCAELCGRAHGFMPIVVHVRWKRIEYDAVASLIKKPNLAVAVKQASRKPH